MTGVKPKAAKDPSRGVVFTTKWCHGGPVENVGTVVYVAFQPAA